MHVMRLLTSGLVLVVALGPSVARGQDSTTIHVNVHVPDSGAHIGDRERPDHARFAIVSRDGQAQLLLMDTTIVAQMTDRGLAHMNSHEVTDTIKGHRQQDLRAHGPRRLDAATRPRHRVSSARSRRRALRRRATVTPPLEW